MAGRTALQPTCEDYYSDESETVNSFRQSSIERANVIAKRSHPSKPDSGQLQAADKSIDVKVDLQSDSGYSSHTAATPLSAASKDDLGRKEQDDRSGNIRLRIDPSKNIFLSLDRDNERRTMPLIPDEDGKTDLVLSGPEKDGKAHEAKRDTKSSLKSPTRWERDAKRDSKPPTRHLSNKKLERDPREDRERPSSAGSRRVAEQPKIRPQTGSLDSVVAIANRRNIAASHLASGGYYPLVTRNRRSTSYYENTSDYRRSSSYRQGEPVWPSRPGFVPSRTGARPTSPRRPVTRPSSVTRRPVITHNDSDWPLPDPPDSRSLYADPPRYPFPRPHSAPLFPKMPPPRTNIPTSRLEKGVRQTNRENDWKSNASSDVPSHVSDSTDNASSYSDRLYDTQRPQRGTYDLGCSNCEQLRKAKHRLSVDMEDQQKLAERNDQKNRRRITEMDDNIKTLQKELSTSRAFAASKEEELSTSRVFAAAKEKESARLALEIQLRNEEGENANVSMSKLAIDIINLTRKNEDLQAANAKLAAENHRLQKEKEDKSKSASKISIDRRLLRHQNEDLEEANATLTVEIQELKKEKEESQESLVVLRKERDSLGDTYRSLQEANAKSTMENRELKVAYENRQMTFGTDAELQRKVLDDLKNLCGDLRAERDDLTVKIQALGHKNEDLQKEISVYRASAASNEREKDTLMEELRIANSGSLLKDLRGMWKDISASQQRAGNDLKKVYGESQSDSTAVAEVEASAKHKSNSWKDHIAAQQLAGSRRRLFNMKRVELAAEGTLFAYFLILLFVHIGLFHKLKGEHPRASDEGNPIKKPESAQGEIVSQDSKEFTMMRETSDRNASDTEPPDVTAIDERLPSHQPGIENAERNVPPSNRPASSRGSVSGTTCVDDTDIGASSDEEGNQELIPPLGTVIEEDDEEKENEQETFYENVRKPPHRAANARFRVKKKQREQALETEFKKLTERVNPPGDKIIPSDFFPPAYHGLRSTKGWKEISSANSVASEIVAKNNEVSRMRIKKMEDVLGWSSASPTPDPLLVSAGSNYTYGLRVKTSVAIPTTQSSEHDSPDKATSNLQAYQRSGHNEKESETLNESADILELRDAVSQEGGHESDDQSAIAHFLLQSHANLDNEGWKDVQTKLPKSWRWDVDFHSPLGDKIGSWTCTPMEEDEPPQFPLTIAGAPVVIPVEYQWPPIAGVNPPPDPRPGAPLDCTAELPTELIRDLFLTFEGSIGFYVLINGLIQIIVPEDFDTEWASSHLPHKYGGLRICYIPQSLEPTMLPTKTETMNSKVSQTSGLSSRLGLFRPSSTAITQPHRLNDFIEARTKSTLKEGRFSGRIGLRTTKGEEPYLIMSTHVITEAVLAKASALSVFRKRHNYERLGSDWNQHVEIWAGNEKIGTVDKSYDPEAEAYPNGFMHDITLVKPNNPAAVTEIKSPIPGIGWLSKLAWNGLRQQTSSVKILGDTDKRSLKTLKTHCNSEILVVGEGIFLNQTANGTRPTREHDMKTWRDMVSRCILYRVHKDFDPPNGYSGIALYADGLREDGTTGSGIVGFQSFVQRSGHVQNFDMEGASLEQRLKRGRVAFYGAFQVPDEVRQGHVIA